LNDATAKDAEDVGIDEVAEIEEVFSGGREAGLDDISQEFFNRAGERRSSNQQRTRETTKPSVR